MGKQTMPGVKRGRTRRAVRWIVTRTLLLAVLAGVAFFVVKPRLDRPRDDAEGPGLVEIESCDPSNGLDDFAEASGTLKNDTDELHNFAVRVVFEDADGVRAGDGFEVIAALGDDETARWRVTASVVGPWESCSVETAME